MPHFFFGIECQITFCIKQGGWINILFCYQGSLRTNGVHLSLHLNNPQL